MPGISFELEPVRPRTQLRPRDVLTRGIAPTAEVRSTPGQPFATASGWSASLHRAAIIERGELREIRLLACYELILLAGCVLVRVTDLQRFEDRVGRIIEVLANVRAELAGDAPAAIAELWDVR
jgi:hypothetical protein